MTKRMIAGALCILTSLAIGVFGWLYLKNAGNELISSAEAALSSGDEEFFSLAEKAASEWDKRDKLVGAIIKHEEADRVDKLYLQLKEYIKEENSETTAFYLRRCVSEIRVILMGEKPGIENVM
ncbi:MAG: DUF4363 family protein [Clostridia bacterium]|nr:DUF4363 family protein [Clostridia bacterium]